MCEGLCLNYEFIIMVSVEKDKRINYIIKSQTFAREKLYKWGGLALQVHVSLPLCC